MMVSQNQTGDNIAQPSSASDEPRCGYCTAPFEKRGKHHLYCRERCRIRAPNTHLKEAGAREYLRTADGRRVHRALAEDIYRERFDTEMPADWVGHHVNGDIYDFRREMIEP